MRDIPSSSPMQNGKGKHNSFFKKLKMASWKTLKFSYFFVKIFLITCVCVYILVDFIFCHPYVFTYLRSQESWLYNTVCHLGHLTLLLSLGIKTQQKSPSNCLPQKVNLFENPCLCTLFTQLWINKKIIPIWNWDSILYMQ